MLAFGIMQPLPQGGRINDQSGCELLPQYARIGQTAAS